MPSILDEILKMNSSDSASTPPRPCLEAQHIGLQEAFAAYSTPNSFVPGQPVQAVPFMHFMRDSEHTAMIFLRYLDLANPFDWTLAKQHLETKRTANADCLLMAMVSEEGGDMAVVFVHDSNALSPADSPANS